MSPRRPSTTTRLTSAIGIIYAEVRTMTVVSPSERHAQREAEDVLQTLLNSPSLVKRIADKMDEVV